MVHDLPGDARRFVQGADGYVATVVAGQVMLVEGQDTGARPARSIRGARPALTPGSPLEPVAQDLFDGAVAEGAVDRVRRSRC